MTIERQQCLQCLEINTHALLIPLASLRSIEPVLAHSNLPGSRLFGRTRLAFGVVATMKNLSCPIRWEKTAQLYVENLRVEIWTP